MTYFERNQLLRSLGFSSYPAYLQGILWHSIRTRVLIADPKCEGCAKKATEVHHNYYSQANLRGESLAGLHGLCADCHDLIEMHDGQKILAHDEVNRRFLLLRQLGYNWARLRITGKQPVHTSRPLRTKGATRDATDTFVTACQPVIERKEYVSKWNKR